jgi:hypothetical protein
VIPTTSSSVNLTVAAPEFSMRYYEGENHFIISVERRQLGLALAFLVPGMTTKSSPWASTHANVAWPGVALCFAAICLIWDTTSRIFGKFSFENLDMALMRKKKYLLDMLYVVKRTLGSFVDNLLNQGHRGMSVFIQNHTTRRNILYWHIVLSTAHVREVNMRRSSRLALVRSSGPPLSGRILAVQMVTLPFG